MTIQGITDRSISPTSGAHQQVFLSWVPERRIPKPHRAFVRRQLDRLARENGFSRIDLRWFGPPVRGGDFWGGDFWGVARGPDEVPAGLALPWADRVDGKLPAGYVERPTIALHAGLRGPAMVLSALAHEVRHCVQLRDGSLPMEEAVITAETATERHAACSPDHCVVDEAHEHDANRYAEACTARAAS